WVLRIASSLIPDLPPRAYRTAGSRHAAARRGGRAALIVKEAWRRLVGGGGVGGSVAPAGSVARRRRGQSLGDAGGGGGSTATTVSTFSLPSGISQRIRWPAESPSSAAPIGASTETRRSS